MKHFQVSIRSVYCVLVFDNKAVEGEEDMRSQQVPQAKCY